MRRLRLGAVPCGEDCSASLFHRTAKQRGFAVTDRLVKISGLAECNLVCNIFRCAVGERLRVGKTSWE